MQSNLHANRQRIVRIALLGLLIAISIVAGKYLAIRVGDLFRFSLENTPVLLAGMLFGPLSGIAVGVIADLVGCILVGYTINPVVTLGAAVIGAIGGVCYRGIKLRRSLRIVMAVALAHLFGSVVIKSIGLAAFYDMHLGILMLWRALNYLVVGALDAVVLHLLINIGSIAKYAQIKDDARDHTDTEQTEDRL